MSIQDAFSELRKEGFTVRVHHVRKFDGVASIVDGPFDNMLTRGEFERAVELDKLVAIVTSPDGDILNTYDAEGDDFEFGKQVSPTGGFTSVTIERDGRVITKGKFSFNKKPFNKRVGLQAAFGRAVQHIA